MEAKHIAHAHLPGWVHPAWLPNPVRLYLDHTEAGLPLREIARREGLAASTVLRQVRRYEARRDDPLMDEALSALAPLASGQSAFQNAATKEPHTMTAQSRIFATISGPNSIAAAARGLDELSLHREARRVLRRLAEPAAVMVSAPDMEKAAVLRASSDGRMVQTAVLERRVAQAFALQDWVQVLRSQGRLSTYEITAGGRAALRRLIEEEDRRRMSHHAACGMSEAPSPFLTGTVEDAEEAARRIRFSLAESPVAVLARRREKDGTLFLDADLVQAAERLREDYELAQMNARGTQHWDACLSGTVPEPEVALPPACGVARARVAAALRDLGPGLGDVALRVCCYLEGLEQCEKRMGWAARSGKIVLRIALQRLRRHYDDTYGRSGPLIG